MMVWQRLVAMVMVMGLCGCAVLWDLPKTIWGSSTRALEEARSNAITKTYDKGYWDCFGAALDVAKKKSYVIFEKDEVRGFMVIIGIPGAVNTTEVGIFFVELNDHQTRIELSSLSTNAKRIVAKNLFHGMDIVFGLATPDKEEEMTFIDKQKFFDMGSIGGQILNRLIDKGWLEDISQTQVRLKKNVDTIRDELRRLYPQEYDQILNILQPPQIQPADHTSAPQ